MVNVQSLPQGPVGKRVSPKIGAFRTEAEMDAWFAEALHLLGIPEAGPAGHAERMEILSPINVSRRRKAALAITSDTYTSLFNDEGHRCWLAARLPVTLRYQLKTAVFPPSIETAISGPDAVPGGWQEPVRAHVLSELRLLDPTPFPDATPNATPDSSEKPDEKAPEKPSGTGGEKPLRKPTKAQVRKMSGADLVPYIEALLGTDSAPSKSKVMDYFSVGAPKAQEALDALASPRPEAAVITLKASQAKTPASRQAQARTPKRAAARG